MNPFIYSRSALVKTAIEYGAPLRIIETVVAVNDARKLSMAQKIIKACGGSVAGKTIAILGLAFKPNTDDMRDAPSITIIESLQQAGAQICAYDPVSMEQAKLVLSGVVYANNAYSCAQGADVLVIITEWEEFRALDIGRLIGALKAPIIVDLRNIYRPEDMAKRGVDYISIGRSFG